ncbi:hypothetical protein ACQW02_12640 [Humitalea sp. 24SJ18S-53]|uniref:hypothetical protein n=1 Tax=Humitalea sp. 24SJ18S-53 TaxID=3422307 RepID=UPI003D678C29
MNDSPLPTLSLFDALVRWSDPDLMDVLRQKERRHIAFDIRHFYSISAPRRLQISLDSELAVAITDGSMIGSPYFGDLIAAWDAVIRDFRNRLTGEIHIEGVQTKPNLETESRLLPSAWMSDAEFNFVRNAVQVGEARYVAVRCSRGQRAEPAPPHGCSVRRPGSEHAGLPPAHYG